MTREGWGAAGFIIGLWVLVLVGSELNQILNWVYQHAGPWPVVFFWIGLLYAAILIIQWLASAAIKR